MTILPDNEGAVATTHDMTNLEILVPRNTEELGEAFVFLAACALRYAQDKDFVQSQISWFYANTSETIN